MKWWCDFNERYYSKQQAFCGPQDDLEGETYAYQRQLHAECRWVVFDGEET